MAVLLQIKNAHKSYGDQVLLDGAEATMTDDVKVGFVGRNGAGKSTLLRILLGEEELDRGEVDPPSQTAAGLPAAARSVPAGRDRHRLSDARQRPARLEMRRSRRPVRAEGAYLEGPVAKLSGGWQTRVKLAALLLHEPNLLLLDEPTNFLDLRTQILLEHFLRDYQEACLIVSHDRAFLGATCTHTLDLSRGKLTMFPGKIDAFLEYQQERREHDERSNAASWPSDASSKSSSPRTRPGPAPPRGPSRKSKQLEKLELIEIASDEPTANIRAPHRRAAQGAGAPLQGPGHRLSRARDRRRHRSRNRSRLAGGDRRRQRPGQDHVSADRRRFARAAGGRSPLGLRLPDRHLRPARLHQPARTENGARLSRVQRRARHEEPGDSRPGRRRCCSAASRSRSGSRSSPAASGPGSAWPACCSANTTCWSSTNRATISMSTRSKPWPRRCSNTRGR